MIRRYVGFRKNRVYNIGEIETLKSSAINLLDTGIEACQAWDDAIVQVKSLQAKTPVKSPHLSSALYGAGKLLEELAGCIESVGTNQTLSELQELDRDMM